MTTYLLKNKSKLYALRLSPTEPVSPMQCAKVIVFIPLCLCTTIAPRSSKLCASGVPGCHLEQEPLPYSSSFAQSQGLTILLRMQRSLGVCGDGHEGGPALELGVPCGFSLSGEDGRPVRASCLSLSLSSDSLTNTIQSQSSAPLKLESILSPIAGEGLLSREGRFLISPILNAQCPCLQHCPLLL